MSFSGLASPQGRRNTVLASVAVAALGVAGALGGNAFTPTHPAYAAAVSTADLPQNAPSFAPLIERVKASVVSVKVKIAAQVQPVLPPAAPGSPFTAIEFDGLTVTPYVDASRCAGDGKKKCAARQAY